MYTLVDKLDKFIYQFFDVTMYYIIPIGQICIILTLLLIPVISYMICKAWNDKIKEYKKEK